MSKIVSTEVMVTRLEGLIGTSAVSARDTDFIQKLCGMRDEKRLVNNLSEAQLDYLTGLHEKSFG